MAVVTNVALAVGKEGDQEFAEVSYDIQFTETEIRLNIPFREWVQLFERDGPLDHFVVSSEDSPNMVQKVVGNPDDDIGIIADPIYPASVRPDGRATVNRTVRRAWDFPRNESGPEEYRALVQVFPEIWSATAWSNEVSINLA
jgi:hypothetical protein